MNRLRTWVVVAVATSLLGSCGVGDDLDFEVGVRRLALSLAFADKDKAVTLPPRVVVQLLPAPPEALVPDANLTNLPPQSVAAKCPAAPEHAGVADITTVGIKGLPAVGRYPRHNSGGLKIQGSVVINLPFPRQTTWDIGDLHEVEPPPFADDPQAPFADPSDQRAFPYMGEEEGQPMHEYSVRKTLTPQFIVVDTYRLTSRRVLLLRRETITQDGTTVFTPDPPIVFMHHAEVEGATWQSAGIDQETGQAMYVDALLDKREVVDVCGTLHDAYRVTMQERMVNLSTGETSGTADGNPNVYHLATQLGGLILREEQHSTQTITTPEGTALITWDYVSTMDATEPEAA